VIDGAGLVTRGTPTRGHRDLEAEVIARQRPGLVVGNQHTRLRGRRSGYVEVSRMMSRELFVEKRVYKERLEGAATLARQPCAGELPQKSGSPRLGGP